MTRDDIIRMARDRGWGMTDHELLMMAAKAAEMPGRWHEVDAGWFIPGNHGSWASLIRWNPLTNDGDALRLAVTLKITPHIDGNLTDAESTAGFATEAHMDDPYAATRRAIVRAAAEIGRSME